MRLQRWNSEESRAYCDSEDLNSMGMNFHDLIDRENERYMSILRGIEMQKTKERFNHVQNLHAIYASFGFYETPLQPRPKHKYTAKEKRNARARAKNWAANV